VVIKSPKGSNLVLILTLLMMCCYVGEFLGRLVTSLNSLKALDNYNEKLEDNYNEKLGVDHHHPSAK
jgi:hypothetical protein